MTRTVRMASLLVALFLLASAATAYAECAWVLWQCEQDRGVMAPLAAYERRDQCVEKKDQATQLKEPNKLFTCLPDTLDPRGPKEK